MNLKRLQTKVGIALLILFIASISFSIYYLFFYAKVCNTGDCFAKAKQDCDRISYVKENVRGSWLYIIKGSDGKLCNIEVQLLKLKEGTFKSEKLEGKTMICSIRKDSVKYPEDDLSKCTGILKEELQTLIIQNMHSYLLENVGELKEDFKSF